MSSNKSYLAGGMFLAAAILSFLNLDYDKFDFVAALPAFLFATVAGIYLYQGYKKGQNA
ncbi:MAG: hypothetical protein AAF960_20265 [Bacteroidota bacterium]